MRNNLQRQQKKTKQTEETHFIFFGCEWYACECWTWNSFFWEIFFFHKRIRWMDLPHKQIYLKQK